MTTPGFLGNEPIVCGYGNVRGHDKPALRPSIDRWLFWWAADAEAAFTRLIWERRVKPFLGKGGNDPAIIADAEATFDRFLPVLDCQLAGKDYVLAKLSIVDFAMAPVLDIMSFVGVDLTRYANITAWLARLRAKPYWKDASRERATRARVK